MKLFVIATSLALIAAAWIALVRTDPAREAAGVGAPPSIHERLERLDGLLGGLDRRICRLETSGELVAAGLAAREPSGRPVQEPAAEAPTDRAPRATEAGGGEAQDLVARLLEAGLWSPEGRALWHELAERGLCDEAIALLRERADARPRDADAQADLGDAIAQQSHSAADAVEQVELARRADLAYDAALALDAEHWRARFHKAVGYTFWPDVLGKQPAAIDHFETLIAQQELQPAQPGFEKTYLYLGNLYAQAGDPAKAQATWTLGLAHFPGDPALSAALGL